MIQKPAVSVIIPTRNRPEYLKRLLSGVKMQDFQDYECIIVDDGSSDEAIAAYQEICDDLGERFQLHLKPSDERESSGPSSTRNRGIKLARAKYIAFCDDDDQWIRTDHLSIGMRALNENNADLFFANIRMSRNGSVTTDSFYSQVEKYLEERPLSGDRDIFEVSVPTRAKFLRHSVLSCDTIIALRELLVDCGMYWEKIVMAEDRELGYRLFDRAKKVIYRRVVTAEYDTTPHDSTYHSFRADEIPLFGTLAALRAETILREGRLRRTARANRAWYLLELARHALADCEASRAREFSIQSLVLRPTAGAVKLFVMSYIKGRHRK